MPWALPPLEPTILESPRRLRALRGGLLSREPDPELQAIVTEAVRTTGFPAAAVTVVLKATQLLRAHAGLPERLSSVGSTLRAVSLCQYVVSSGQSLDIDDAGAHPELAPVVAELGVRAYHGVPLAVGEHVAGGLCVIDVVPHEITPTARAALRRLGGRASRRLSAIATHAVPIDDRSGALAQARHELESILRILASDVATTYGSLRSLEGVVAMLSRSADGPGSESGTDHVLAAASDTRRILLAARKGIERVCTSLEARDATAPELGATTGELDTLVRAGAAFVPDLVPTAGPFRVGSIAHEASVLAPALSVMWAAGAAFQALASGPGDGGGIDVTFHLGTTTVSADFVRNGAPPPCDAAATLARLLDGAATVAVERLERGVRLTWWRAGSRRK